MGRGRGARKTAFAPDLRLVEKPHVPLSTDGMIDSWDALIPPEVPFTLPLPPVETFPATDTERQETPPEAVVELKATVEVIPSCDKRFCHWCACEFTPTRKNQIFCTPSKERKKNWERRQALVAALAEHFKALGRQWVDMLALAQRVVDAAYTWVLGAMQKLGWEYGLKTKTWKRGEKW